MKSFPTAAHAETNIGQQREIKSASPIRVHIKGFQHLYTAQKKSNALRIFDVIAEVFGFVLGTMSLATLFSAGLDLLRYLPFCTEQKSGTGAIVPRSNHTNLAG